MDLSNKNNNERNIKEQLIKSVNAIKNKIKEMKNEQDQTDLHLKQIFKPITNPLREMVEISKNHTKRKKCDDVKSEVHNTSLKSSAITGSNDSMYEDIQNENSDFSLSVDRDHSDSEEVYFKSPHNRETRVSKLDTPILTMIAKDNLLDENNTLNIPFGIRCEENKLMMGNLPIHLKYRKNISGKPDISTISIDGNCYEMTPGLKELLLKKKPNLALVSETDKAIYKNMLVKTNAHKRDYTAIGQVKGDKGMKYCKIIKTLFNSTSDDTHTFKHGGNIPVLKKAYKKNTDFIYWDDPNEIIERLRLLIASKEAGNTNHDNEMISIIEELKEAGVIKE